MSISNAIDPATGKFYDSLIPQGGGINLAKGQIITATATQEVAFPNAPPADGSILSYDSNELTGLKYIAIPGAVPLDYQELISANQGNNPTVVPAPTSNNYVLTSDNTLGAGSAGMAWKALGGSGVITAVAPLQDLEPVAGTNELSIAFTAVKGELPAGNGTAKTGALVPAPPQDKYVLTSDATTSTGLKWSPPTGASGIIDATAPLVDEAGVGTNTISINFTAVKGEIPAGSGVAKTGALVPAPATNGYVLTADSSTATGLAWKQGGAPSAQTNFFRLTVPAVPPFTTAGVEIELPAPNTVATFTDNEQFTMMNYEVPASSANNFAFQSIPFIGASYIGTGAGAINQTAWFVEDSDNCYLLKGQLPLSSTSSCLVWASFSNVPASGNTLPAYVSGIVATTDYVYFYGYFDGFNTASGSSPVANLTNCGNIVKYNKTTGVFSKLGTGGLVYSGNGNNGEICSVCVCPTDDKSLGNYLSNPKTLVLGGSFTQTLGGGLACPYIAFYNETTDTFSIVGDQAGDGITAPAPTVVNAFPVFYINSLVYNTNTNALLVSMNKVDYSWTIGGVPFVQYNGITSFGWKVAPASTAIPLGTSGQILNPNNRGIGIGIIFKASTAQYWLLIGYTDAPDVNCWWKLLDEPTGNPLLAPTSNLPPLQYRGASGAQTCDIPIKILYARGGSNRPNQTPVPFINPPVDGSASRLIWIDDTATSTYVAYYLAPSNGSPAIQQFISSSTTAGSWSSIANAQNQFNLNQSLLPSIVLIFGDTNYTGHSVVANTSYVGVLYIPSGISYYAGTQGSAVSTKVIFGSTYSSIQAVVDLVGNTYRVVSTYGNIQFS